MKEAIKEYCAAGVLKYSGDDQDEQNKNVVQNAHSCSSFIRLYAQLSIQRQFVLTDVAVIISSSAEESSAGNEKEFLMQTAMSFIYMMQKEQKQDIELLRFLVSSINYPQHGFAVYSFYDSPNRNGLAISYIKSLCNAFKESCPSGITACTKHFLEGRCITVHPVSAIGYFSFLTIKILVPYLFIRY